MKGKRQGPFYAIWDTGEGWMRSINGADNILVFDTMIEAEKYRRRNTVVELSEIVILVPSGD